MPAMRGNEVRAVSRDNIRRMARKAGILFDETAAPFYERFAALVAAAEREACAKVVNDDRGLSDDDAIRLMRAIRARGQQ